MLRKAVKRNLEVEKGPKQFRIKEGRIDEHSLVLGDNQVKDDEETVLEQAVLGDQGQIAENLVSFARKDIEDLQDDDGNIEQDEKAKKIPKPAWEDEDDKKTYVKLSKKDRRHNYFKHTGKKEITAKQYNETLKNQFEKISGAPTWARMKWEKSGLKDDSDTEDTDLLRTTGDYLDASESLPSGNIDLKRCTEANKEAPCQGKLSSVEFHPTAQVVLTAGTDQRLHLFQVDGKNNPKIQSVFVDRFPITCAHFSTDGREVVLGSDRKCFYYYDMIEGKIIKVPKIKGLENMIMRRFKMSPDGKYIVFMGLYGDMHLISTKSKELISSLKMNGSVEDIAFNSSGSQMYSIGDDGEVYVWDMNSLQCVHRFVDEGCVTGTCITASKDNKYIATGSYSGVVNVYNDTCLSTNRPTPVKSIMNLTSPATHATFNSTSEILAVGSNYTDAAIKLVHLPSFTVFKNFPDRLESNMIKIPKAIDFSLNSGYLTIGNHKGNALLYRVKHFSNY